MIASGSLFTESSDLWCWKAKPPESATNCSISKNLLRVTEDASQVQEILILKSPTVIFYIKSTVDTLLDAVARSVTDGQKRAIGRGKKKCEDLSLGSGYLLVIAQHVCLIYVVRVFVRVWNRICYTFLYFDC